MKNNTILERTSYSLFILDLPCLRKKTLRNAVRNYLVGLFPDNLEDRPIVIKRNYNKKNSCLVFVLEPGQKHKPLPVSTLFIMRYFRKKTAKVLFLGSAYAEFILIENGILIKSEVKSRAALDLDVEMVQHFGNDTGKIDIFCCEEDLPHFKNQNILIAVHILEKELPKFPSHSYSLFEQLSAARRLQKCFIAAIALLVICGTGGISYHYQKIHEEEISLARALEEKQKQRDAAEKQERLRLLELQERYRKLVEHKVSGPYETIDSISRYLDDKARVSSITIRNGFFQMEALAPDSLEILKAFETAGKIMNPQLQQIHPEGTRERFTISGTVLPEREILDPYLSPKEQILLLETLIGKEENSCPGQGTLQPSSFGIDIRGLLKKWNCSINSYQYQTAENHREMEFSIKATSRNFFNFLHEASADNKGWIFTMVQIRNLVPQNAVHAVFRVKAETVIENEAPTIEPYTESPVSGISRHFYTAPPPPPPPAAIAEIPEEIPPLPEPLSPPVKPEPASWLEYVGAAGDDTGTQFIYVKNTRNGAIIRLDDTAESENWYSIASISTITAQIDGKLYELKRN